jgi:hypothetical protein
MRPAAPAVPVQQAGHRFRAHDYVGVRRKPAGEWLMVTALPAGEASHTLCSATVRRRPDMAAPPGRPDGTLRTGLLAAETACGVVQQHPILRPGAVRKPARALPRLSAPHTRSRR